MERELHEKLRRRIRQVIAERAGLSHAPEPEGGFLPLLPALASVAAPVAGKALGWLGEKIFGSGDEEYDDLDGEGKHGPNAKTHRPNRHARKVKQIMAQYKRNGTPITLGAASKLAAQELRNAPAAPKPRKARKAPAKKAAPKAKKARKPRKPKIDF